MRRGRAGDRARRLVVLVAVARVDDHVVLRVRIAADPVPEAAVCGGGRGHINRAEMVTLPPAVIVVPPWMSTLAS